jgi:predicted nuclease of predicted toxin-antitoxin system
VDAIHVDHVPPLATRDTDVLTWAIGESRLVVTANEADFLRLARESTAHPGLGSIDEQNTRVRQVTAVEQLVRAILHYVDRAGILADHVFVLRRTGRLASREIVFRPDSATAPRPPPASRG